MARHMQIATETTESMVDADGAVDVTAIMALSKLPFSVEWTAPGPTKAVNVERGETYRKSRGATKSATRAAYHTRSGVRHPNAPGTMDFEHEICQPGAGLAWTIIGLRIVLLSAYALDTPAIETDTVTGVGPNKTQVTPVLAASWKTGDLGGVVEGGAVYPFRVTGRSGNDAYLSPGIASVVAGGTTARLYHRLYMKPRAEGASFVLYDHQDTTLWIGVGCRLGNHSFRVAKDGRLLLKGTIHIGRWIKHHSATNPWQSSVPAGTGGPVLMQNARLRITNDYYGDGGGLTTAPQYANALTGINLETFEVTVERTIETVPGLHNPLGFYGVRFGEATITWKTGLCDMTTDLAEDLYRGPAVRHIAVASSQMADGAGMMFWGCGQVDSEPELLVDGEVRDKQEIMWKVGTAAEPIEENPAVGTLAVDANNDGFCIGLMQ